MRANLLLVVPSAGHVVVLDAALGRESPVLPCQPGDMLDGVKFDRALVLAERDAAFEEWWAEEVVPRFTGQVVLDEVLGASAPVPNPTPASVPTCDELGELHAAGKHAEVLELARRALRASDVAKRLVANARENASREGAELAIRLAAAEARLEEADSLQERMLATLDRAEALLKAAAEENERLGRQLAAVTFGNFALKAMHRG